MAMNQKTLFKEEDWQDWIKENGINPKTIDKPKKFPCTVVWTINVEYVFPMISINMDSQDPVQKEYMRKFVEALEIKKERVNIDICDGASKESVSFCEELKNSLKSETL